MTKNFRYKCITCGKIFYRQSPENNLPCKCGSATKRDLTVRVQLPLNDKQKQFIKNNYRKKLYAEIAKNLGISEFRVNNFINKSKLRLSKKEFERRKSIGKFEKGHISWNKGLSLPNKPNSGQFVKGQIPSNTKSNGTISLRKNASKGHGTAYYYIRISKNKWQEYHRYLWEQHYGPVPKGMVVRIKNFTQLDRPPVIEELELITHQEHLKRNQNYSKPDRNYSDKFIAFYITRDPELKKEILKRPDIIEAKRQQLKLWKELHAAKARRKIAVNA